MRPAAGPSPEAEEGKPIKEPQEVTRKPRELCLWPGVLAGSPGVVAPSRCVDWHLSVTWCGASGICFSTGEVSPSFSWGSFKSNYPLEKGAHSGQRATWRKRIRTI